MCGIFAYLGDQTNAAEIVWTGLKNLEYRGYDSWGIVLPDPKKGNLLLKRKIGQLDKKYSLSLPPSHLALGHTRWATHGGVTVANAHPHLDCSKRLALVHNGIVENYAELKSKLLLTRHHFSSQTDTEVLVHLIEELLPKKDLTQAVREVFKRISGMNAIVVMDAKTNQIVAAKTGSPLVCARYQNSFLLASDSASLLKYSKELLFLEDGQILTLAPSSLSLIKIKTGEKITPKFTRVDWNIKGGELGSYKYFMEKEIDEQPRVITDMAKSKREEIQNIGRLVKKQPINIIGCGSAYFAGLAGVYFLKEIAKHDAQVFFASEFSLLNLLPKNSVVLALSQSGETIDLIEAVNSLKGRGIKIIAAINTLGSTLYRLADTKFLLLAGPEKCVLATKSYLAKLTFLYLLAHELAGTFPKGQKNIFKVAEFIDNIIDIKEKIRRLAKKLSTSKSIFIIGRDYSYPAALEFALKIKEVSYIHAEGFAGGELKHGVIALIEKGTPCIVLAPRNDHLSETLSNAMELKARGGFIIGLSPEFNKAFDYWLPLPDLGIATAFVIIVYGQLLSYYLALTLKYDPDKPRNLAKSVTVK